MQITDILAHLGGSGLLDNVLSPQATNVSQGNDILGQTETWYRATTA